MRSYWFEFPAVFWLAALSVAALGAAPADPLNGSFESVSGGLPRGWTVVRGNASADRKGAHEGRTSVRLESEGADACLASPEISLTVGRRYEVRGWIRTDRVQVTDLDRSPIAIGAALTLGSAPFDFHSQSIGGTGPWTEVRLRFTATRPQDHILLTVGLGGKFDGRAWFDSISFDEISPKPDWPARAAVQTFGPAYRYPTGGWIYLHIEGAPYERGFQHGRLLAHEIEQYVNRSARAVDPRSSAHGWELARTTSNALFLHGFDAEILQEMKGIADGATAGGAKFAGRNLDLVDIAALNTLNELFHLRSAMTVTPNGLEGLNLRRPEYSPAVGDVTQRCSAFAATGPATGDGKMVIGHITMSGLSLSEQTNILLDVQPSTGHRVLMQSFPGGIESGTDYYQNDAGVVLTETTIRQSPFNVRGTPVAYRARRAIQYGSNIAEVVKYLTADNNGLYTNEWLIGDAKDNEIAMFELGTNRTKLYRSSRNEWFGGTEGFYWGCNNAKDLAVRLEYEPDPKGEPVHVPFVPSPRDIKWQDLYRQYKGQIDERFGFLAFRTAPLVTAASLDAKLTTSDMASHQMCWAVFGKPNQREWPPTPADRRADPAVAGIYSSGYRLIDAELKPDGTPAGSTSNEKAEPAKPAAKKPSYKDRVWEGWILPALDSELWLSAGSAAYYHLLKSDDFEKDLQAERARYLAAALKGDQPLRQLVSATDSAHGYDLAAYKGALLFDALRRELGDDRFFTLMRDFFASRTGRMATSQLFFEAVDKAAGKSMQPFFTTWLDQTGLPGNPPGAIYLASHLYARLSSAMLVYGTVEDAGANRYAAEQLQLRFLNAFESAVPIRKDFETSEEDLQFHDVIFVGRPETNSALAAWKDPLDLSYDGAAFRLAGTEHASEREALVLAAPNPLDRTRMVLVLAGNCALETVRLATVNFEGREYAVYRDGKAIDSGFRK